jgi:RNA polymerase sigma-70 factor (ECF subfamily)
MTAPSIDDLLQRHRTRIDRVAFAYAKGPADRDEIAQAIAVQLWRALPRLLPDLPESSWVYRIALNVAIAHARSSARRARTLAEADVDDLPTAAAPEPEDDLERLRACLDEFAELDRALVLLWLDGEDHAAIGRVLGLSTTNVGTRLHRLRQRLREAYERRARRHDREPRSGDPTLHGHD